MKIPNIELEDVSRYRAPLMGVAMLLIILFHVPLSRWSPWFGLYRCGNIGVDMFLFLSGVGLWFSWTKTPSLKHFFRRRYLRVYPAWLVVSLIYFIPRWYGDWSFLVGNVLIDWDFWRVGNLTFWYVPAIMMLYTLAPLYIKLICRYPAYRWLPVVMVVWCVMVNWIQPLHAHLNYLEIFWSRVPIFFIGVNMGQMVKEKRVIEGYSWFLLLLVFALAFGTCVYLEQERHGLFPLFVERMLYIPLTITMILLLNQLLRHMPSWVNACLKFVGLISLEVYLIHVQFVLLPLLRHHLGYWLTALLTAAISITLAWSLNKVIAIIENLVKRRVA